MKMLLCFLNLYYHLTCLKVSIFTWMFAPGERRDVSEECSMSLSIKGLCDESLSCTSVQYAV